MADYEINLAGASAAVIGSGNQVNQIAFGPKAAVVEFDNRFLWEFSSECIHLHHDRVIFLATVGEVRSWYGKYIDLPVETVEILPEMFRELSRDLLVVNSLSMQHGRIIAGWDIFAKIMDTREG